jgi:hypothetical protein
MPKLKSDPMLVPVPQEMLGVRPEPGVVVEEERL